ncbi:MAG: glycerol-3-phosphate dehydrogenase [Pseudomonadota bacterium]
MTATEVDILVIGGGINGCGIARDAVGRGYSVCLVEKGDLASGTSSWSTKLIHGGLRYLEHYEFRLVREALMEREVLWSMAPHIIWPMRFVLPHQKGLRPAWLLRLGLFLYDYIGGRKLLPPTKVLNLKTDRTGTPLKPGFSKGFEYSDCWVQDTRLTILNARDAADRGADVRVKTECIGLKREGGKWTATVRDAETGVEQTINAMLVINAAGPWVDNVLRRAVGQNNAHNVRLVQGSHIVVPKLFEHDRAYIFQNADERIIFAIPYEQDFTLIGTTDRDWTGAPEDVAITEEETDYLCSAASEYFREPITPDQIVWTYSGVRPLYDDGASKAQEATRDYVLKVEGDASEGAMVNIFGGKITTYRRLAESVMEKVEGVLGTKKTAWTAGTVLPGGDFGVDRLENLVIELVVGREDIDEDMLRRLCRNYGTEARGIIGDAREPYELGMHFGADLYEAEVRHLMDREWARTADDVLWRRSKLGLKLSKSEAEALDHWMADARHEPADERIARPAE